MHLSGKVAVLENQVGDQRSLSSNDHSSAEARRKSWTTLTVAAIIAKENI